MKNKKDLIASAQLDHTSAKDAEVGNDRGTAGKVTGIHIDANDDGTYSSRTHFSSGKKGFMGSSETHSATHPSIAHMVNHVHRVLTFQRVPKQGKPNSMATANRDKADLMRGTKPK